jgi:hypothetical protein
MRSRRRALSELPIGTVTLLFTDIAGSTGLLQRLGPRYGDVITEYRTLLRSIVGCGNDSCFRQPDDITELLPSSAAGFTLLLRLSQTVVCERYRCRIPLRDSEKLDHPR